jgi:hypothetical protein
MTRRETTKGTISYIIGIRKTSIRCTITPRIPTNMTLANTCRVHIIYIERIKLRLYVLCYKTTSHFDSSILVFKWSISCIDDRFHVCAQYNVCLNFAEKALDCVYCRYCNISAQNIASRKDITHIIWALSRFSTSEFFRPKRPFSFVRIHFATSCWRNRQI